MNNKIKNLCPVCGYDCYNNVGFLPWDEKSPSDEICPCCGIQFGYQDLEWNEKKRNDIYNKWRQQWIQGGMKWDKGSSSHPKNWDPIKQLNQIM